ncbi:hypothetical protein ACGFIF_37150 [Kribbella sp. NPDC049174]|uniref:hypothetical protein n=1 Tax=Kribbella sp. NPDC049174 TaxID=3364112 RepID=UPI00371ABFD8
MEVAQWKAHFNSGPSEVYRALSTPLGRSRYWAESAGEHDGMIRFVLPDGRTDDSRIERAVKDELYQLRYFGRTVTFTLTPDESGGTDLTPQLPRPRRRVRRRPRRSAAAPESLRRLRRRPPQPRPVPHPGYADT